PSGTITQRTGSPASSARASSAAPSMRVRALAGAEDEVLILIAAAAIGAEPLLEGESGNAVCPGRELGLVEEVEITHQVITGAPGNQAIPGLQLCAIDRHIGAGTVGIP